MTTHVVFTDSPTEDTITAGIDFAAELDAYALKASPAFTGTPTAPTATLGTNTTQLATCAFVQAAAAAIDLTAYAPKASPTFTGTPAAPTATLGTNTTQLATCAFVQAAVAAIDLTAYAAKSAANVFTNTNTFRDIAFGAHDTYSIGTTGARPNKGWFGTGGIDSTGVVYSFNGFYYTGSTTGLFVNSSSNVVLTIAGTQVIGSGNVNQVTFRQGAFVGFSSTTLVTANPDTGWVRESAGVLAQRNGTNAQTSRLSRTYADASNQAYLEQTWSGNNALIRTIGVGTGTAGDLVLGASSATTLTLSSSGGLGTFNGALTVGSTSEINFGANCRLKSSSDGLFNVNNTARSGFTRFTLGPESVNFPSLKVNSGVGVDIRAGDDSAYLASNMLYLGIVDGATAPSATLGIAKIYVDTADGDLKVIFGDGTIKTISTDT